MKAPFPWFGGKRRVAALVWQRFGDVTNYVEPFFGSGAVLLARPHPPRTETINDLDCFVANFWRAVQHDPEAVARWADNPVNEADLHARHLWLVNREEFRERMRSDPDFYDPKIAGWWVWGISCWIGSGWCSKPEWAGRINGAHKNNRGVNAHLEARRPNMTSNGVHQNRNARLAGLQMWQKRPSLERGNRGSGQRCNLVDWMQDLAGRLRRVRVCCGDWTRILGRSPTECVGVTAVFLDPPYDMSIRDTVYGHDEAGISAAVRDYALASGHNPKLRIALCGYAGEHEMPPDWHCVAWKANGGLGNTSDGRGRANATRERIWFSPHCLIPDSQGDLF